MSLADIPGSDLPRAEAAAHRPVVRAGRDPRLDFYRGIAMVVILFSHTPGTVITQWMPVRWGFSDAAEVFVFCSGMASGIAFGATFLKVGWILGAARIAQRIWQLYWAHLALFFAIAAFSAWLDLTGWFEKDYIGSLNLHPFFENPAPQLLALFTLTYVPNYFDILPMYMVLLALVPAMMALARITPVLALAASVMLWLMSQGAVMDGLGLGRWTLEFPAEPWSNRPWFFNPFAWQLVFFSGFSIVRGWIPAPAVRPALVWLAVAIVGASFVVTLGAREFGWDWAVDWRSENRAWISKTDQGVLRYLQFLAMAYLGYAAAGPGGAWLRGSGTDAAARAWQGTVGVLTCIGQQSLAVFIFSMFLARALGVLIDLGDDATSVALVAELAGACLLVLCAYTVAWFKRQPWRAPKGNAWA